MNARQKYSVIAVASLMVAATIILCLFCFTWHGTQSLPVRLPPEGDIEKMTATINDSRDSMGISPIPTFVIPPEHYAIILSALTPTERYEYPAMWEGMTVGQVEIITKDGKSLTISFCEAGNNKLCFSVDGIRCMRGGEYEPTVVGDDLKMWSDESMVFYNILYGIHEKTTTGKESEKLTKSIEMLQRSKGERNPKRK